jgi:paraquat-inducible protein B
VSDAPQDKPRPKELPRPRIRKMRWPFPLIWLVPLCAAAGAGYYHHLYHEENATEITVKFKDVSGLKPTQTPVTIHGVEIGRVTSLELADDLQQPLVHIALQRKYAAVAREGALFWVVQPDFSNGTISGLSTIVSGPYIEVVPGVGAAESQFVGLERQPVSLGEGLILILHSDHLEHLQPDSPILYRGIQVGAVQDAHLAPDATHVNITVVIWEQFARLVTNKSQFWSVSGADVKGGIFSGISVKLDSLRHPRRQRESTRKGRGRFHRARRAKKRLAYLGSTNSPSSRSRFPAGCPGQPARRQQRGIITQGEILNVGLSRLSGKGARTPKSVEGMVCY